MVCKPQTLTISLSYSSLSSHICGCCTHNWSLGVSPVHLAFVSLICRVTALHNFTSAIPTAVNGNDAVESRQWVPRFVHGGTGIYLQGEGQVDGKDNYMEKWAKRLNWQIKEEKNWIWILLPIRKCWQNKTNYHFSSMRLAIFKNLMVMWTIKKMEKL